MKMLTPTCLKLALVTFLFKAHVAWGLDFKHEPVLLEENEKSSRYSLVIPAQGIKRARVIVQSENGPRLYIMQNEGAQLKTIINFEGKGLHRYAIQAYEDSGAVTLSPTFEATSKNAAVTTSMQNVFDLSHQAQVLQAKNDLLENAIHALQIADPQQIGKNSKQELQRALDLEQVKKEELAALEAHIQKLSQKQAESTQGGSDVQNP